MKIGYIIESSYNSGGMERMLSVMANAMSLHHDISVITAFNNGRKDFFPLNPSVSRHDFCIDSKLYSRGSVLKKTYKNTLTLYLKKNHFDIIVSMGSMEMFFLHSINDNSTKIIWFHFALNRFIFNAPFRKLTYLHKVIGKLQQYRVIYHAKKYDKIVVLSKSDLKDWRKFTKNVTFIYNPITILPDNFKPSYDKKSVIAVGRLSYQKGFDYLIDAWKLVNQKFPDWSLNIYGEGPMKDELSKQIVSNKLSNVVFLKGRCNEIEKQYVSHSLFVLSSRYEGFVLVLLEASACGLPMVSYNCKQGPSEIIEHNKNGLLVNPVGDIVELAKNICFLLGNEDKREIMGKQAKKMSMRFSLESILPKWLNLFEEISDNESNSNFSISSYL